MTSLVCCTVFCFFFFFFFQAEDGIRDYKVTGVQTCALPIWVLATVPTAPVPPVAADFSWVVNWVYSEPVVVPKAAAKMGSGTCPARPWLANELPLPAAWLMARLLWAFWNSLRNPFSK